MRNNVFRNSFSSHDSGNKIATSIVVQKPYLRTIYVEAKIEDFKDLKKSL